MKRLLIASSIAFLIFTGCDTPMAAAKRDKLGITWEEWQQGIRTKEAKDNLEAQKKKDKEREIQMEFEGRRDYVATHPNLRPEIASGVMNRTLVRGMNADEVYLVWGYPKKVNKSVGRFGQHEQWVYDLGRYAYFENGILDSWQTSE